MRFVSWRSMARRLAWMRFCISTAITFPILQPKSSPLAATWSGVPEQREAEADTQAAPEEEQAAPAQEAAADAAEKDGSDAEPKE